MGRTLTIGRMVCAAQNPDRIETAQFFKFAKYMQTTTILTLMCLRDALKIKNIKCTAVSEKM